MRKLASFSLLLFACFLLPVFEANAQRIRWEPPGGSLGLGQTSQLSLIFENCEPQGEFALPPIPHLTLGTASRGEQSSVNIVNGQLNRTRTVYYTYPVRPTERTTVRIPAFTIQTDEGAIEVPPAVFEVGEPTIGGSSVPLDTAANSRVTVADQGPIWAGQVVPVDYVLSISGRYPANIASAPEWDPAPLIVEEWSRPEPGTALINGENRNTVTYRTRGYIRQPGTVNLGPISQLVNLRVPSAGFSLFQAFQAEQYTITSNVAELTVRPLPTPAPAAFDGAVGSFSLSSKVVPEQATVGEPVTWTLELNGRGNWPDIAGLPPREVSKDFRVVQPQARRTPLEGKLFEATMSEDVVLIPTQPGTYQLGPVTWTYFDPTTGRYQTVRTEPVQLRVEPAATAPPADAAPSTVDSDERAAEPMLRIGPPPTSPTAIPRDPIRGQETVARPWRPESIVGGGVALFCLIPLVWLGLATQRAWRTDPKRPARAARQRLRTTIEQLRTASAPDQQRSLLRRWQADAAALWTLRSAAPSATAFQDPAWLQLWRESEQVLFGPAAGLPSDWPDRAARALSQKRAPSFRLATIFRPNNLLPLFVFCCGLATSDAPAQTVSALDAYGAGDFRKAEQLWQEAVRQQPRDWVAHHNLALALAQQQRWGEAAAHATVALVQNPRDASVQWHFHYTLGRAGYSPMAIGEFATPDLRHRLALWFSPSHWQQMILLAIALLVTGGLIILARAYFGLSRYWNAGAVACGVLALLAGLAAGISLPTYGATVDARSVLVWRTTPLRSVPTEVPTDQQTSNVAAGSIAVIDREFLDWRRVAFANGQTGWLRREEVVGFWERP